LIVGSGETSHRQPGLTTLTRVTSLSDAELDALVEQAIVDAYDEHEQHAAFHCLLEEHLIVPFQITCPGCREDRHEDRSFAW
jgi:hypothetical protein